MHISSTRVPMRPKLRPHLPKESSNTGNTAADMAQACQNYIQDVQSGKTPALDPYSSELDLASKVELSRDLEGLANDSQADFAAQSQTAGSQLRLGQLQGSLQSLQTEMNSQISELNGAKKSLKSGYHKQVAKTIGWMAGTAGALIIGGVLPNPISVLGVGVMAACTIKSIGKARSAQKNLAKEIPQIQQALDTSKEVLANTVSYGPAVAAWDSALGSSLSKAA
jgi:hypothetical protein